MFTKIADAQYSKGGTYMKTALKKVKTQFDRWQTKANKGYAGYERLVVFLTDGKPSGGQDPCDVIGEVQQTVGDANVIVVGMGTGWSQSAIECMVTPGYPNGVPDLNRILVVDTFTNEAFNDARVAADDFLCPKTVSVKLTEVRMESYSNAGDTHDSRWIELYNDGAELDFAAETLAFEGFMSSTAFGKDGDSSCTAVLAPGQYLVIYDPTATDDPFCEDCACAASSGQCTDALYLPCGSTTNGCGTCNWNTASNDAWTQTVKDPISTAVLTTATRASELAAGWTKVYTGYSTELKSLSLLPDVASNWQMSCTGRGTPGDAPLQPCTVSCIQGVCAAKGDGLATCHPTQDICDCSSDDGWYLPSDGSSCVQLAIPLNCVVENSNDPDLGTISTIRWTKGSLENDNAYFEIDDTTELVTKVGLSVLKQYEIPGGTIVTVRSVYNDRVNGLVYSAMASCGVDTAEPTPTPTQTPTESNADVPSCIAKVEDYNVIYVSWEAAIQAQTTDIAPPVGGYMYWVYGNWIKDSVDPATKIDESTSALSQSLYVPTDLRPLDIGTNGAPDIWVVTEIDHPVTGATDYELMRQEGKGKVRCVIETTNPTKNPTKSPTKDPSESPSKAPSKTPTQSPTYGAWDVSECVVTIPTSGDLADGDDLLVRFTYSHEADAARGSTLRFFVNGQEATTATVREKPEDATVPQAGASIYAMVPGISQADVDTAMEQGGFEASVIYDVQSGTQGESAIRSCTYTTAKPTVSPTESPSREPSKSPSEEPSESPTRDPSATPTASPTYEPLTLDPCSAELNKEKTAVTVSWTETTFDDPSIYPQKTEIYYDIGVGPSTDGEYREVYREGATKSGGAKQSPPLELPEGFEWSFAATQVTIDIADGLGSDSLPIVCTIVTQSPTDAPTTPSPTAFPTSVSPMVRLDLLDAEQSVKDGDWGFDGECHNLGLGDAERRRRLADEEESDVEIVKNCPFCPVCTVKEDIAVKYLHIIREPADFTYDVVVKLKVTHLTDTDGGGMTADDFDFDKTDRDWHNLFKAAGNSEQREYIVGGSSGNTIVIPYYLKVNDDPEDTKETAEAFEFRITACEIDESGGATVQVDKALHGVYTCSVGAYYAAVIISVEQPDESGKFTQTTLGDLPKWVWIPIGFAAVAIPFVAYLIYRFYKGRKKAEKMEVQRTFELGEAEKQDDVAEFGVAGDLVTANPLATGAAFEVAKGDVAIQKQLEIEKMNFEMATTEVEHNVFKQDFGPVQAEKHDMNAVGPARPETAAPDAAETAD